MDEAIADYYAMGFERERLGGWARLERLRTCALLERHLPQAPTAVLAAAISRLASAMDGVARGFLRHPGFEAMLERDLADGRHENPDRIEGWRPTACFHRPEELAAEVEESGLALEGVVGIEGPSTGMDAGAWLDDPGRRALLLRTIARVEAEPALLGASAHLLGIARRP